MQLTEQDKSNLVRFGCTLHPKENLLYVRWSGLRREQALAATILFRSIYRNCTAGPLLCLALEISPTRALAHYCYFPINLTNQTQRKYLASLAQNTHLHLGFVSGRQITSRDYMLAPAQCKRILAQYTEASEVLQGCAKYSFSKVLEEFEKTFRIPQFFERALSDNELAESMESLRVKADHVSPEKRTLAHHIVHGIADVLRNRYGDNIRKLMAELQDGRQTLLALFDFQREFGDDFDRLVDFVTDSIAVNTDDEALRKASDWPSKLDSILKSFEQAGTSAEAREKVNAEVTAAAGRTLDHISRGRGLSLSILQNLVLPFRALLPAQAGRPSTKDYSREYNWKASGMSWTEVTRKHLQENAEVRAEFGGRDFDSLTFEDKENLRNRVREGVRSYAEKTGKPFPLPESSSLDGQ